MLIYGTTRLQAQPLSRDLIRVAILKGADSVTIDGNGLLALPDSGLPWWLIHRLFCVAAKRRS